MNHRSARAGSAFVGPGRSSTPGQMIGETTSSGVSGCPSRIVSRNPCTAGMNARSRNESAFTMLMPSLRLIASADRSLMARAVYGSSCALPPKPRFTSRAPARRAAMAGQVSVGRPAAWQWLIELPWCTHRTAPRSSAGASSGASARSSTRSTRVWCGSQISTSLSASPSPSKRTVPTRPGRRSTTPVSSKNSTLPATRVSPAARTTPSPTRSKPPARSGTGSPRHTPCVGSTSSSTASAAVRKARRTPAGCTTMSSM